MSPMIELSELTILNDLRERLAALAPEELAGFERKLLKPVPAGSMIAGVVNNHTARGVFILASMLTTEGAVELARASAAHNADVEREHSERASMLATLAKVFGEIFWAQVKVDFAMFRHAHLTLHAGWTVVEVPCGPGHAGGGIIELLLGGPRS